MRIALIADIHGNSIAFDAVLADAAEQHPDTYLFLGDLVDGHDLSGILERIRSLPNTQCIYGNTEQYILTGNGPPPYTVQDIPDHLDKLPQFQQLEPIAPRTRSCGFEHAFWYAHAAACWAHNRNHTARGNDGERRV